MGLGNASHQQEKRRRQRAPHASLSVRHGVSAHAGASAASAHSPPTDPPSPPHEAPAPRTGAPAAPPAPPAAAPAPPAPPLVPHRAPLDLHRPPIAPQRPPIELTGDDVCGGERGGGMGSELPLATPPVLVVALRRRWQRLKWCAPSGTARLCAFDAE